MRELINEIKKHPEDYRCALLCSLKRFIKVFHFYLYNKEFVFKPFHDIIIKHLEDVVFNRREKKNLIINVPVRSGKTQIIKYFLAWTYAINKDSNCILTSYGYTLAMRSSQEIKDLIQSDLYAKLFCIRLDNSTTAKDLWKIDNGGELRATSMGGVITGFGVGSIKLGEYAGAMVIDDPLKADDYKSVTEKDNCWDYYVNTLKSRLNNPKAPIILIMQRLAKDDLTGRLLEYEPEDWDVIKIPALLENGESYWEEKNPKELLIKLRDVHPYTFYSQYQQEPIVLGGELIKREWFKYYDVSVEYKYKKIVIAGDTAMTVKENSDYTCYLVGGITEQGKLHILQMVHKRMEYPELKKVTIDLYNSWQRGKNITSASALYLEDRASGIQLVQDLRKSAIPVIPIEVTKDKLARVEEVLEYIASGNVLLPVNENYGDNPKILSECEAFTRDGSHEHDDIVDTLVHLINNTIANRKVSILEVL